MDIEIPAVPVGVLVLLNFFAPYAIAVVTNPRWPAAQKKVVAIVVSLVLAAAVLLVAFLGFGLPIPAWPALLLLAVVVSQASYALVTKNTADATARAVGVGKQTS